MRRPNAQRTPVEKGARIEFVKSVATYAAVVSACGFAVLGGACGDPAAGTATGNGGAGGVGSSSGQGGEGLQDFVTSSSSGSTSSSSGAGGSMPTCDPPGATGGTTDFAQRYGSDLVQTGVAVSVDKQGNILLAGALQGSMDLGAGPMTSAGKEDAFIAKFSPAGQLLWAKRFGDGNNQSATGIGADANGNVFVTGIFIGNIDFGGGTLTSDTNFFQDVFLAKFGPDGTHVFSKKFGDSNIQYARTLAVDSSGNVLIAGHFQNNVDFGNGAISSAGLFDAFVAKFTGTGQVLWSKRFGDAKEQVARSLATDAAGNVYVAGEAESSIDFGQGSQAVTGAMSAFVAKLDPAGAPLWSKVSAGVDMSKASARAVAVGPTGAVAVVGSFSGSFDYGGGKMAAVELDDAFVTTFTASGAHTYTKSFGTTALQTADSVAVMPTGDVLVTGSFAGNIDFGGGVVATQGGFDTFFARLGADGCASWAKFYGGPTVQAVQSLVLDSTTGRAYLTGSFNGTADFGAGPLTAVGDDVFLLAVKP